MSQSPRFLMPFEQGMLERPTKKRMLVIRPADTVGLHKLADKLLLEQGFLPIYNQLEAAGFSVTPFANRQFTMVLVNLTRSKAESLYNIARACAMSDGVVLVNGAKTDGIESILKQVKKITPVEVISKAHGKVFWFDTCEMPQEWLSGGTLCGNKDGYITQPGMFSHDKADVGSKLLAPYLSDLKGRVADLGAGWGWLSRQAMGPDVTETVLFEAEHKALASAKFNFPDTSRNVQFEWADVLSLPKMAPFDVVISNPPFHQSRTAEPGLGVGFIIAAAKILKPKGRLLMVANRQLPYERALEGNFRKVKMLEQTNGFKVFEASHPKR